MDPSSHVPTAGRPPHPPQQASSQPPRRQLQIQGPRPTALKLHPESHKIKKPPLPPPRQQPVIIYAVSPKIIHTEVSNFMAVVQRLTGLSSGDFSHDGSVSPAARLAATEKASPRELRPTSSFVVGDGGSSGGADDIMEMVEGVDIGQLAGILSPAPAMLPPVPTGFFSPASEPNTLAFLNDMSPFFMPSPSTLFSTTIVSPLHSPDIFNLFMDP